MTFETDQDSETGAAADYADVSVRPMGTSPLESKKGAASTKAENGMVPLNNSYRMGKLEYVLWSSSDGSLVVPMADLIADGGIRDDRPVPIRWTDSCSKNQI